MGRALVLSVLETTREFALHPPTSEIDRCRNGGGLAPYTALVRSSDVLSIGPGEPNVPRPIPWLRIETKISIDDPTIWTSNGTPMRREKVVQVCGSALSLLFPLSEGARRILIDPQTHSI